MLDGSWTLVGRGRLVRGACVAALALAGCRSDLNQQLLERELRYQEDQIYHLQDELHAQHARLEHLAGENTSLRRQLGVSDDAGARRAPARPRAPAAAPGVPVPPAIEIPDGGGPPVRLEPPALEGVPPLPAEPTSGPAPRPPAAPDALTLPPPAAGARLTPPPTATPAAIRLGYETDADGPATHLVISPALTGLADADGDGRGDGITVGFEPRDAAGRLVATSGDVTVTVFDTASAEAAGGGTPLARWTIPAAEAAARFRRTGRGRGVQLALPWQAAAAGAGPVRVHVHVAAVPAPLEADATVPLR